MSLHKQQREYYMTLQSKASQKHRVLVCPDKYKAALKRYQQQREAVVKAVRK